MKQLGNISWQIDHLHLVSHYVIMIWKVMMLFLLYYLEKIAGFVVSADGVNIFLTFLHDVVVL